MRFALTMYLLALVLALALALSSSAHAQCGGGSCAARPAAAYRAADLIHATYAPQYGYPTVVAASAPACVASPLWAAPVHVQARHGFRFHPFARVRGLFGGFCH